MRTFLFVPCFVDQLYPNVAVSALRVLEHLGCEVVFPENQTCCGQPAYNSGYEDDARLMAVHEVKQLVRFGRSAGSDNGFDFGSDYVVGLSGSCVAMIRKFYPSLLADDPLVAEDAGKLSGRIFEFSEFISKIIGTDRFRGELDVVVSYHDSCHSLRELGVESAPREILRNIKGLKLVELPYRDVCCGFGGTFSVKFPEISASMADEKLARFGETRADVLVSADSSCLMHLEGRARRTGKPGRFAHIAEIMSESIR